VSAQSDRGPLTRALAAIDDANREDPNVIDGRPRALVQGERATVWLERLDPDASEALVLAARAHHVKRWTSDRASYPDGRAGYLRWRRDLKSVHAATLGELLPPCGVDAPVVERARELVSKTGPSTAPDAQTFEDVVCLVFLETQFEELIDKLDEQKTIDVLRKTLPKMSAAAIALAASADLHPRGRELLGRAAAADDGPA
jgi:Domain of unknown function (DUF4202)